MRDHERTARRGETIGFVFAMQGVGAVTGSVFLLVLIHFAGQSYVECDHYYRPGSNSAGFDTFALTAVWRCFYFIGTLFVFMVLLYRFLVVEEGEGHVKLQKRKERRAKRMTYSLIFRHYGLRLIGTGMLLLRKLNMSRTHHFLFSYFNIFSSSFLQADVGLFGIWHFMG
jgi:hypothetical protein